MGGRQSFDFGGPSPPRLKFVLVAMFLVLFIIFFIHPHLPTTNNDCSECERSRRHDGGEKSFYTLAKEVGTDKVDFHNYECVYEDTLRPYRYDRGVKVLEIGLGCGMSYGPGASMKLWASYFTDPNIYFLEYDQKCGEKWLDGLTGYKKPIMTYGDQADVTVLRQMAKDHGPWDIIIDDGGHTMNQQITSFTELFPLVAPGGTYYLEDLNTSFIPVVGGTDSGLNVGDSKTALGLIAETFAASIRRRGLGKHLERMSCCDQICSFHTFKSKRT